MAALVMGAASAEAQNDSLKAQKLDEVVVRGVRASKDAPFAVANIKKSELQDFSRTGKELPFLLQRTPGVLAWSENGMGTGTTYMRIRGAADSRINITLDGVALNSPEDQCVFWANMNSYASLLGSVQVQRGVGSSTNGDGAFGGSISLATAAPSLKPTGEVTASWGSYGTWNVGANFSTGLLFDHLIFDGAYHETNTSGYIHGTGGRSGSYYGGLTWLGDKFKISYKNIGNFEKTGQAWNGVLAGDYDGYVSLLESGVKNYRDLYNMGLGKWNTLTENIEFGDNGSYTLTPYTMRDGSLWGKTTDNFHQNHNLLSAVFEPNEHWSHMVTLHYTYGHGYYTEFKSDNKFSKYGINETYVNSEGKTKDLKSDFVRDKGLTQHTYGIVYNVNWKKDNWDVIGGVNLQQFRGAHWGYLTYIADEAMDRKYRSNGDYQYYDSHSKKFDYSAFIKANYKFCNYWNVFADVQYRHVTYKTDGNNDKFKDGQRVDINIDEKFNFVNPKVGMAYTRDGHKAYFSFAMSNREPERNNYLNQGTSDPYPKAERLYDYELGYQYNASNWHAGANFYYMKYDNQLTQSGKKSDIGESLTVNVKDSYRAGVELNAGWAPLSWFSVEANAALSANKIKDFTEYVVTDWDDNTTEVHYDNSTLSFSPSAILNGFLDFHYKGFAATWHTNFVSKQYLDNTQCDDRSLPAYSQTDIALSYDLKMKKQCFLKDILFGLDLNNIFNAHYAASGFVWYSHAVAEAGYTLDKRFSSISYIPMAGFTLMGHLTFKF